MLSRFGQPLNVLIVENNPLDSRIVEELLAKSSIGNFTTQVIESLQTSLDFLKDNFVDIIILDLNLSDCQGLKTLHQLHAAFPDIPVVINTGAYEDDLGLKAIGEGAQDFLIKGKYEPYGLAKALYFAMERKNIEKELKTMQDQLIQSEKMHVIGTLASGVAHEVRNPLATILYGVEYLDRTVTARNHKIRNTLHAIEESAQRADQIICDLLDFSSLSLLNQTPEDIREILKKALGLLQHQIKKSSIEIIQKLGANVPPILMDHNRIEQVFVNLILNAIQAMPQGGRLTISIGQKRLAEQDSLTHSPNPFVPGESIVFVDFEDTGDGIPEEFLAKIFDPFFTTKRSSGGTGLGLAIARSIMERHLGLLKVFNKSHAKGVIAELVFKCEQREVAYER